MMISRVLRSLSPVLSCLAIAAAPGALFAQCSDSSTLIYWIDSLYRTGGNNVEAVIGTQIVGDYSDYWAAYVSGSESVGSTALNSGSDGVTYGGNDVGVDGTAAGWYWNYAPSNTGAGQYTTSSYHEAYSLCGEDRSTNLSDSLTVNKPTISGFFNNNSFWNLGDGSNDPQVTWYGSSPGQNTSYYYQSVNLTFVSNCGSSDSCGDTPQWTLTTNNNQTALTSTSGTSTTITKGSWGSCAYDSTLTVSIGGFSSDPYYVAVDSPYYIYNVYEQTNPWNDGYLTQKGYSVKDRCQVNDLLPVPVNEEFPDIFYAENGSSNYATPAPVPFDVYTDWPTQSYFVDNIGQCCNSQSPALFVDSYGPYGPPYMGNTVYLQGTHLFFVGSLEPQGSGIP